VWYSGVQPTKNEDLLRFQRTRQHLLSFMFATLRLVRAKLLMNFECFVSQMSYSYRSVWMFLMWKKHILSSFTYTDICTRIPQNYKLSIHINSPTCFSVKLPSSGRCQYEALHNTHPYTEQGLDSSELKTLILDVCMYITTYTVNNGILMNCNQEYVSIILAIVYTLLYS
jgi:hypothetical protein